MKSPDSTNTKANGFILFVLILGIVVSFLSVYTYASKGQAGNATWTGGLGVFFFTFLSATRLANMRKRIS